MKEIFIFIAGICLLASCSKSDQFSDDDLNAINLNRIDSKSLALHEGTVPLQGYTRFAFYLPKEGRYITDGYTMNFLECEAELIFGEKQSFVLHTKEYVPTGAMGNPEPIFYREISFTGQMSPSGQLKLTWPETWWELGTIRGDILSQVREHTGSDLSGQGINKNTLVYMGSFDANKFFADMHILGLQQVPGTMPFFAEIVDGPVMINFMIDLEIME